MYGLLSQMMSSYRIRNDTKEKFRGTKHLINNSNVNVTTIVELIFSIAAILALMDIWVIKQMDSWLLILFLILYCIPIMGDIVAVIIITYWLVSINNQSVILQQMKK